MGWHCLGMLWERQQIRFQQLFAGRVRYWKLSFLCKEACPPGKGPFSLEYHQNEHPPVPSDNFNHGPFVDDLPPKNAGFPWFSITLFEPAVGKQYQHLVPKIVIVLRNAVRTTDRRGTNWEKRSWRLQKHGKYHACMCDNLNIRKQFNCVYDFPLAVAFGPIFLSVSKSQVKG